MHLLPKPWVWGSEYHASYPIPIAWNIGLLDRRCYRRAIASLNRLSGEIR